MLVHERMRWVGAVVVLALTGSCINTRGSLAGSDGARLQQARTSAVALTQLASARPVAVQARTTAAALESSLFAVPPELRSRVNFWKDIFGKYSRRQVVIHDALHLERVYSVLDFRGLADQGFSDVQIEQAAAQSVKREKERIREILLDLHRSGGRGSTDEEKRIAALFRDSTDPRRFQSAAAEDRVRAQPGILERFGAGIEIAHRYWAEIEEIFRQEGVPVEISRLPLIESCFNVRAYSKKGAAGVWQFIPSTARLFMRVDDLIDERRDPVIAARAAARFLRQNYDRLGTWPLAITAYNHGPGGVSRAVRELGTTDIVKIIERYQGPAFKFASRNFYPEFLAALEVEREHERHFGPLRLHAPVPTDFVVLTHFLDLDTFALTAGVDRDVVMDLNPSLSRAVYDGKQRIPRGYGLRIPADRKATFEQQYASLPDEKKFSRQRRLYVVHRVQRGQTLAAIARRYGITVEEIRRHNTIRNRNLIRVGDLLRIPSS